MNFCIWTFLDQLFKGNVYRINIWFKHCFLNDCGLHFTSLAKVGECRARSCQRATFLAQCIPFLMCRAIGGGEKKANTTDVQYCTISLLLYNRVICAKKNGWVCNIFSGQNSILHSTFG
ncbi:hypothetical protein COCON_G00097860 [Conger conger]|uniref:Uncharacterized protein n=1 Tax=Conger conger TaxID=82655 RepID=A0A9Q1DNA2_CONCO|nr:hypothetical protein COCON_G00097860 [Conger conger]